MDGIEGQEFLSRRFPFDLQCIEEGSIQHFIALDDIFQQSRYDMPLPSELTITASSFAKLIISHQFVMIWCAFIGLYGLKWLLHLYWAGGRIKWQLKKANKYLSKVANSKELTRDFTDVHNFFTKNKTLKTSWMAYQQTLLKFPVENSEATTKDDDVKYQHIRATCRSEEYFNQESIVQPEIDQKILSSIPNLLSGMGILGTFCGLSCRIYIARHGLAGGNMEDIQRSLAQLLSGASLAFCTSIVGILTSLVFAKVERFKTKDLCDRISTLTMRLNYLIQPVSLEQIHNKQLIQSHKQNVYLDKIAKSLDLIHQSRVETNAKVLKEVAQEFHHVLVNSSGQEIKYIASAFQKIHQGLKETKDALNSSGKYLVESVQSSTNMFKKNLHEMSHQFQTNFNVINQEVNATFVESSKKMKTILNQSALEMSDTLKKPAQELGGVFTALEKQIKTTGHKIAEASETNAASSKQIFEAQAKLSQYVNPLLQAGTAISKAVYDSQTSLKLSAEASLKIAESVKTIDQTNKNLNKNWESHCKRFEGIDRNLYQVFHNTNSSLNSYSEKVKNFTLDLDKHLSKGMLTLAEAVGDLNHVLKDLPLNLDHKTNETKTINTRDKSILTMRNIDQF